MIPNNFYKFLNCNMESPGQFECFGAAQKMQIIYQKGDIFQNDTFSSRKNKNLTSGSKTNENLTYSFVF